MFAIPSAAYKRNRQGAGKVMMVLGVPFNPSRSVMIIGIISLNPS